MATFKYRCQAPDGSLQVGFVDAITSEEAAAALSERGLQILILEPYVQTVTAKTMTIFNRIKSKDIVFLSRMLSVMISANVPLVDALKNISVQATNPNLKQVMFDIATEVEAGSRLSDALERHPKVFSGFFVNMVRSGETSGQLEEVLEYLADQQEKDFDLMSKIRSAMTYPAFILAALFVVGFVMMSFVVPKLTGVLVEAGMELPLSTRVLISISSFFERSWILILLGTIVLVVVFMISSQTPEGRRLFDGLKLRIPVVGDLLNRIYIVRFARSLATLIKGGVDQVTALEIVAGVMGNTVWKNLMYETIQEVNEGNSMTMAFQRKKFIPQLMNQMVVIGEDTGRLQEVLNRIADFFRREVDNAIAGLVALIEPLVIVLLGVAVAFMVSAILLPMYQMSSAI